MGLLDSIGAGLGAINPVAAIATGTSVLGPILGAVGTNQTNQTNQGIANQANLTTEQNNAAQEQLAQENINLETEFAQNGLSWKIADAAKNGISPLAAIGATEPSYSPVSEVLGGDTTIPQQTSPLNTLAAGIPEMSQNISRALTATQSPNQKASDALDLAYKSKENDLLDVQIANAKLELAAHAGGPGPRAAFSWVTNSDNSKTMIPSYNTHDTPFGGTIWMMNNKLIPGVNDLYTNVVGHGAYVGDPRPGVSNALDVEQ